VKLSTLTRDVEFYLGIGNDVAVPLWIAIVTALRSNEDDSMVVDDGRRQNGRSNETRDSTNRLQFNDGHSECRAADTSAAEPQHSSMKDVECFEPSVDE
jgi:hypothetical protein